MDFQWLELQRSHFQPWRHTWSSGNLFPDTLSTCRRPLGLHLWPCELKQPCKVKHVSWNNHIRYNISISSSYNNVQIDIKLDFLHKLGPRKECHPFGVNKESHYQSSQTNYTPTRAFVYFYYSRTCGKVEPCSNFLGPIGCKYVS